MSPFVIVPPYSKKTIIKNQVVRRNSLVLLELLSMFLEHIVLIMPESDITLN